MSSKQPPLFRMTAIEPRFVGSVVRRARRIPAEALSDGGPGEGDGADQQRAEDGAEIDAQLRRSDVAALPILVTLTRPAASSLWRAR